jgi:hypothetical protein
MGDTKKMAALEATIRRACQDYDVEEVGPVLTTVLIDFAKHVGMPKDVFASMIIALWGVVSPNDVEVH